MTSAIIVAAGRGRRFGCLKQFAPLCGKPLVLHTVESFERSRSVEEIVLVVPARWVRKVKDEIENLGFKKVKKVVRGGQRRMDSVYSGLLAAEGDIVVIHDGVRPLVTPSVIDGGVRSCKKHGACIYAIRATDTVKLAQNGSVKNTLRREEVYLTQTPQVFERSVLLEAYVSAYEKGIEAPDDSYLVERIGVPVKILNGFRENIKVTSPSDLRLVETLMGRGENE
jgi:2-C-methyl-D-erythritol 4-phosphate cytidylyltransferase